MTITTALSNAYRSAVTSTKPAPASLTDGVAQGGGLAASIIPQSTIDSLAGINVAQQKAVLFDNLRDATGVKPSDYTSTTDYRNALSDKIASMQSTTEGAKSLTDLSTKLGLDALGVSLATIVGALVSPGGEDDQALEHGIRGTSATENAYFSALARFAVNEDDGTYSPKVVVAATE